MFEPLPALIRLQREAQGYRSMLCPHSGVSRTRLIALEKGDDNISQASRKIANALRMKELRISGLLVKHTPSSTLVAAARQFRRPVRSSITQPPPAAPSIVSPVL
jgi:hypothetical protein